MDLEKILPRDYNKIVYGPGNNQRCRSQDNDMLLEIQQKNSKEYHYKFHILLCIQLYIDVKEAFKLNFFFFFQIAYLIPLKILILQNTSYGRSSITKRKWLNVAIVPTFNEYNVGALVV